VLISPAWQRHRSGTEEVTGASDFEILTKENVGIRQQRYGAKLVQEVVVVDTRRNAISLIINIYCAVIWHTSLGECFN
jgi:hypothetical protein